MRFNVAKAFVITTLLFILMTTSCSTLNKLENLAEKNLGVDEVMASMDLFPYKTTYPIFYDTGAQWNEHSLDLIAQAEDYILISTFLGVEHPSVYPVWKALANKMEEGVRVYIIIDSSSNFQMVPIVNERIKAAYMQLHALGIEFVEYNSLSTSNLFFLPKMLDRDHRKYWVVDGKTLAIGGVNINHTSIDWPAKTGNIDTMVEVYSPEATKEVVSTFVDTWNNYSPKHLNKEDFFIEKLDDDEELTQLYLLDHHWPIKSKVSTLFDLFSTQAKRQLWMIQGYTFLTPALLKRIEFATNNGVEVNIMLSDFSTQPKYELASRYGILDLIDAGANVYMYHSPVGAFLHAKIMIADQKLVTVGSANYNFRSQTLSRELNLVFDDEKIASQLLDYIETLLKESRKVTRQEAISYRNFRSWYNYVLMQVWG